MHIGITGVILTDMKTAISIPDELFEAADRAAKMLEVSRSELYATAVLEYVNRHRNKDITEKLDEVYASNDSSVDPNLTNVQLKLLSKEKW